LDEMDKGLPRYGYDGFDDTFRYHVLRPHMAQRSTQDITGVMDAKFLQASII